VPADEFHVGDVYVPCDPAGRPARLRAAGFDDIHVDRLRAKIEADPANPRHLLTVRGLGYKVVA